MKKPYRWRRWRLPPPCEGAVLFTCARPGRSKSRVDPVPDDLVHEWVKQLPEGHTAIVSLLGFKPDGMSEFAFYSFCSGVDSKAERGSRLSFQEWLDRWHSERGILVIEHPTRDFAGISDEAKAAIAEDIFRLTAEGRTVILVDSGGETRTGLVCNHIRAREDSSQR